jgi:DNA (cytosine-5)-methyltransferase 1
VPCYDDVRTLTAERLRADGISVDVICGGFPCQDVSVAGARGGLEAARSGLWSEYHRLVCELRPRYVIVENTTGLLSLGMGRVLGDLAASGYDCQWDCIPAKRVGAPHERDRVWVCAYPNARQQSLGGEAGRVGRLFQPVPWHRTWAITSEPVLGRGTDGIPNRVDRCGALGNAVVPQIPELIGNAILASLRQQERAA